MDSALVIAMMVQGRSSQGESVDPESINSEIKKLISSSVINGRIRGDLALNIWGKPFEINFLPSGGVTCHSPGLFGWLGEAQYTATPR